MGFLGSYAKKKPQNPDEDVVMASESESEIDFDTAIKNAAEGFRQLNEKDQKRREKFEPGSPELTSFGGAIRRPNHSVL